MALALALKYRPKNFEDLVGQEAISQTLSQALDKNRIVHAYLFSGLRGSGKTSSARIFARALECEKGPTSTPCGECGNCKAALEGRNIDIIEMDGASNRGIDNIRDLIEQTKYAPAMGRFKIFIIDEVHMLSREAFNALLKTLEEPPEYVKFILATTDPLKVPVTILSRTQHFRFKKIPQKSIIAHLKKILDKEEVKYEDSALDVLTRAGGGSLRDTLTLTDQAINYCNKFLTTEQITKMLGVVDPKILQDFFLSILHNDEEGVMQNLQIFGDYECEMILDEMLLFLKDAVFAQNPDFPTLLVDRFLRILTQSKTLSKFSADSGFVLLLTSLKMKEALKLKDIDEAIKKIESSLSSEAIKPTSFESQVKNQPVISATNQPAQPTNQPAHLPESNTNLTPSTPQPQTSSKSTLESTQSNMDLDFDTYYPYFVELKRLIFDRSLEVGEAFERSVEFVGFKDNVLYWDSHPNDEDKITLAKSGKVIQEFVQHIFGAQNRTQNSASAQESLESSPKIKIQKVASTQSLQATQQNTQNSNQDKQTPQDFTHQAILQNNNSPLESKECKNADFADFKDTDFKSVDSSSIDSYAPISQNPISQNPQENPTQVENIQENTQENPQTESTRNTAEQPQTKQAAQEKSHIEIFLDDNKELVEQMKRDFGVTKMYVESKNE